MTPVKVLDGFTFPVKIASLEKHTNLVLSTPAPRTAQL